MPGQTLYLVHVDEETLEQIGGPLVSQGWDVKTIQPDAPDLTDLFASELPVAAVWCLEGDCADQVRMAAAGVLADERIVRPLMIFIGGTPEAIAQARASVPYGVFVNAAELPWVLKRMVYKA